MNLAQLYEQKGRLLMSQGIGPKFSKIIENKIKKIEKQISNLITPQKF
jgi:hypothetical protein